jgi:type I restriction enzyme R subunit
MPHAYSEDQLVEQPAIGLFAELGWQSLSAFEETFGAGGTLGLETPGEAALERAGKTDPDESLPKSPPLTYSTHEKRP